MAEIDWTFIDSSLSAAQVARGVTAGFDPPVGGGDYAFGFNSRTTEEGAVGLYYNAVDFGPMRTNGGLATGGSIRAAIQRATSAAPTGFAPFLFFCLRAGAAGVPNPSVNDVGYLLGLEDNDPSRIVFHKGAPVVGLSATPTSAILRASTASQLQATWLHLRLDVIVNPNGDTVVQFFQSDLTVPGASVATPTWETIPGMTDYIDDALGIRSGSSPLSGGYAGFGFQSAAIDRRAFFDMIEVFRQVT